MKPIISENKGLTLIEVVVASTILIIVSIPMYSLFNWSISGVQNAGEKSQLVAVARGIMEENLAQGTYLQKDYTNTGTVENIKYEVNVSLFEDNEYLKILCVTVQYEDKTDSILQITTIRDIRR